MTSEWDLLSPVLLSLVAGAHQGQFWFRFKLLVSCNNLNPGTTPALVARMRTGIHHFLSLLIQPFVVLGLDCGLGTRDQCRHCHIRVSLASGTRIILSLHGSSMQLSQILSLRLRKSFKLYFNFQSLVSDKPVALDMQQHSEDRPSWHDQVGCASASLACQ